MLGPTLNIILVYLTCRRSHPNVCHLLNLCVLKRFSNNPYVQRVLSKMTEVFRDHSLQLVQLVLFVVWFLVKSSGTPSPRPANFSLLRKYWCHWGFLHSCSVYAPCEGAAQVNFEVLDGGNHLCSCSVYVERRGTVPDL